MGYLLGVGICRMESFPFAWGTKSRMIVLVTAQIPQECTTPHSASRALL
jgi:hypothetical protein